MTHVRHLSQPSYLAVTKILCKNFGRELYIIAASLHIIVLYSNHNAYAINKKEQKQIQGHCCTYMAFVILTTLYNQLCYQSTFPSSFHRHCVTEYKSVESREEQPISVRCASMMHEPTYVHSSLRRHLQPTVCLH